jgi:hypothetical protein
MPSEVRSALIGMLVVFKVKAMLPFTILPILKTALIKAVTFPIILPAKLIGAKVAGGAMIANALLNQTGGLAGSFGGLDLAGLGLGAAPVGFEGLKNKSNGLLEILAQIEALKPNPAAALAGLDLAGFGAASGSFEGFKNKNNSLLEVLAQLEALKPSPAAALGNLGALGSFKDNSSLPLLVPDLKLGKFNLSNSMGSGAAGSFGGMPADKDLGLLLAAAQLAALQKFNKSDASSIFGGMPAASGAAYTFGGLTDKDAQIALLISQLAQLQKFNKSGMPSLGLSNMRMAAATGFPGGFMDKNSSSFLQMVEALKPQAVAALASLIGSGSTGAFAGFADKNTSSILQLLAQLEALKPNPAALLAGLTDKNNTLQMIEQLAQIPVFNPAAALAAMAADKIGSKVNSTLPELIAQLEALKPNPTAQLAGLMGSSSGDFGAFGGDKNATLSLLMQLAAQKPGPGAVLAALGGLDGAGLAAKNITLPPLVQLALQKPKPLAALEALGAFDGASGLFGGKNFTLPPLLQLALQKPNPLAVLEALSAFDSTGLFGGKNVTLPPLIQLALQKPNPLTVLEALSALGADKNVTLPLLVQAALQKPNPFAILEALGAQDVGAGLFGDKNFTLPLLDKLQKFNISLPDFPGLNMGSMTVSDVTLVTTFAVDHSKSKSNRGSSCHTLLQSVSCSFYSNSFVYASAIILNQCIAFLTVCRCYQSSALQLVAATAAA